MALTANQKKRGTQREQSPPDEVSRTGRDSFLKKTGSRGVTRTVDSPEVSDRAGRSSGAIQISPAKGIGRGNADGGGDGVSVNRIDDNISSV